MTVTTEPGTGQGSVLRAHDTRWERWAARSQWDGWRRWASWVLVAVVYLAVVLHRHWSPIDLNQLAQGVDALAHGHITAVYTPNTALTSPPGFLVLAAPLVAITGGYLAAQPTVALVGMASAVFLAVAAIRLAASIAPRRHPAADRLLAAGLLIGLPFTSGLNSEYHPQDLVATGLLLLAIDATIRRESAQAGLALGAALLTRQWALLAVGPLLLGTPAFAISLRRVIAAAASVIGAVSAPFLILDRTGFLHALAASATVLNYYSVWDHLPLTRSAAYSLARIAPLACCVPTAIAFRRRWRRFPPGPEQLLGACLLCLTYRMVFETDPLSYYFGPMSATLLILAVASSGHDRRLVALTGFAIIEVLLSMQSHYPRPFIAIFAVAMEAVCLGCCAFGWTIASRSARPSSYPPSPPTRRRSSHPAATAASRPCGDGW